MLHVAFLTRPCGSLTRRAATSVIRCVSGAPVHVELVWPDGRAFSAWPGAGVGWGRLDPDPAVVRDLWRLVPVPWADPDAAAVFCQEIQGAGYDWTAIVGYPLDLQSRHRWQCVEVVGTALHEAAHEDARVASRRLLGALRSPCVFATRLDLVNALLTPPVPLVGRAA